MRIFVAILVIALANGAYNRDGAMTYVDDHWNNPNHDCTGAYSDCNPQGYFGSEHCGYASHGGDCANFVSQALVLGGGHDALAGDAENCRGFCGIAEVGAKRLGDCLVSRGWTRTCGQNQAPPAGVQKGDVLIFHASNCDSYSAHATIVTSVTTGADGAITAVTISGHSPEADDVAYTTYAGNKPYLEWLTGGPTATIGAVGKKAANIAVADAGARGGYTGAGDADDPGASPLSPSSGVSIAKGSGDGGAPAAAEPVKPAALQINARAKLLHKKH